ncbi:MAG TPA: DUF3037 domain-containing protein [Thermoanaerobaculia bacterium]|jgi:hypothetical protein|nr:DUF3037 domain-containing protein [Thermoanaerobaculia bacterium]HEV8608843.1 DUF3037 domain-containing protein [Thermoanaerobaculia bacterium]
MTEIPCDYVLARFVANPLRDEARNIGVILRAPTIGYAAARFLEPFAGELQRRTDEVDLAIVSEYVDALKLQLGPLGKETKVLFDEAEADVFSDAYFHGLAADFAGNLQFTQPRGAVTADLDKELLKLFDFFVRPAKLVAAAARIEAEEKLLRTVRRELETRRLMPFVGTKYPIKVRHQQLEFKLGYRPIVEKRPRDVVVETVDLSADNFSARLRSLSPATVKFDIAKRHRTSLEAVCLYRSGGLVKSEELGLEVETLKRHTDSVFDFGDASQREKFLKRVQRDLAR